MTDVGVGAPPALAALDSIPAQRSSGRTPDRRLLDAVVESLDEGLVVQSPTGRMLFVNPAAERILGIGRSELLGRSSHDPRWGSVHEDGTPWPGDDHPAMVAMRTGVPQRGQLMGIAVDHTMRWIRVSAVPVLDQATGRISGSVTSFAEVTAERETTLALQRSQRDLVTSEERLRSAHALTGLAWWELHLDSGDLQWSTEMYRLVGLDGSADAMTIGRWRSMVDPDDLEIADAQDATAAREGSGYRHVFRVHLPDGRTRYLQAWATAVAGADGRSRTLRGATLDVTEREEAQRALADREEMFRVAFDNAPIGMTMISLLPAQRGKVLRVNAALASMFGYSSDEALGRSVERWTHSDDVQSTRDTLDRLMSGELSSVSFDKQFLHRDGHTVPATVSAAAVTDEHGRPLYLISHYQDMTQQRRQRQELERLALTDTLTGLANRVRLEDRVRAAIAGLGREPGHVALLLLDLDRFKLVNDSLGHQAGDALLIEIGRRLAGHTRSSQFVARLGGDEFVVLVDRVSSLEQAEEVARRLLDVLREPFVLPSGETLVTTSSLGIATASSPDHSATDLFREADLALYRAKDAGRNRFARFDDGLRSRAVARLDTESRIRHALAYGGLRLHFQPVVALRTGRIVGYEALVRVDDAERGLIPPTEFIAVAEDSGLIVDIDTWVAETVVAMLPHLPSVDGVAPKVAVNASARTLDQPRFVRDVAAALQAHGVRGDRLLVELTESILLDDSPALAASLAGLSHLGAQVGIDDFGTGYSALSYLSRFRLDFLKIDRAFVCQLGTDHRSDAVVAAIIKLAHGHDLTVTAEGVETREQAALLRAMGCDHGQGWLFGRPEPPSAHWQTRPPVPVPVRGRGD